MRCTSEVTDAEFPFAEDTTAFILVFPWDAGAEETKDCRGFEHASTATKKLELVERAINYPGNCSLLAVWPGATRSDVFLVDDLEVAARAFDV
jgi:hypothetical protein